MIIEKVVARKTLAVTLALALFASTPMNALAQTYNAPTGAVSGVGALGAAGSFNPNSVSIMAPITMPNMALNTPSLAPSVIATLTPAPLAPSAAPISAQALAVEAHPVIAVLNALQAKGVQLPDTMSTRADAAKLVAAAAALPEGSAKQGMIEMAAAITAANNAGSTAQLGKIYDAAQARAEAPEAVAPESGWRKAVSKLLPAPLARMVAKKASEAAPAAQPAILTAKSSRFAG